MVVEAAIMDGTLTAKSQNRYQRIRYELRSLGMSSFGLRRMEAKKLPSILHEDEHLGGIVYGHGSNGFAFLVATDRRIIYLDVKPLFCEEDEVTYDVVSGLSYGRAGIWSTVTLHTKVKDYQIRSLNHHCAEGFIAYIEARCVEHRLGGVG